ncbi:MAG: transposase, partial [Chloroflexi bacterium]|nr:transposase [Chloroflexota bacterium]
MAYKPPPLQCGLYYHIHSRGINRENVFFEERNYAYFLALYTRHFAPVADTFAYCLMRNHFHFLVRIKDAPPNDTPGVSKTPGVSQTGVSDASQKFSNCLNAYAKAINKAYNRTGSLFQNRFGRHVVDSDAYFLTLIAYIHRNPEHHHFVQDFRDWPYSSYQTLLSPRPSRLSRDEVLAWFGSREA